ncbi:MAG TPA: tetratricopeptide repeat protein, partial [Ktedonobacteraceae bacterium]|nr:tetratricopeptide repeat protein [Ktedonobacteraceae bacterium]
YFHKVTSLNGLANLRRDRREYAEAESLYQRALSTCEQHLGQQHPETAQTLHNLAILRQKQGHIDEALTLAQRALVLLSQTLGETHPKTVGTRTLSTQLLKELSDAQADGVPDQGGEKMRVTRSEMHRAKSASSLSSLSDDIISPENHSLQAFLDACCDLHPNAWCRSADLWRAYIQWTQDHQEHYPLSRAAFITRLKTYGCRAGRTRTARIWRGIVLVSKRDDGR